MSSIEHTLLTHSRSLLCKGDCRYQTNAKIKNYSAAQQVHDVSDVRKLHYKGRGFPKLCTLRLTAMQLLISAI